MRPDQIKQKRHRDGPNPLLERICNLPDLSKVLLEEKDKIKRDILKVQSQ